MGQRSIDTVLRVPHEGDYKAALKSCTSELKVLKTELDKVTSDFRTNANSMDALTAKGQTLSKMYAAQQEKVDLLQAAMQKAQASRDEEAQAVAELNEQYESARKVLKDYADQFGENSEEYEKQKAAVNALRDAIIQHQAKLDSSTRSAQSYEIQLNRASVELDRLSDQQETNTRLMEEASAANDHCATSIDRYGDSVREAGDKTGDTVSAVDALSGALVAGGIREKVEDVAAAMMDCSHAAQEYEVSLQQIRTIADETVLSQEALHDGTLSLAMDLHRDVDEITDAAYNALSAGVETGHVLDFTAESAKLATAGFTDLGTSVDVLTTIENAYQLSVEETERVSSILVKTQDLGKITVDDLGKVMGRVIPSAAAYNVGLENIAASYAVMTAAGVNAENSTTNLTTLLDELADSGSAVSGILQEQTGNTFAGLMDQGKSLGDVLQILSDSVDGDNVAFANLWASSTAAKGALGLFDGTAAKFNDTLRKMENSSGTVAKNYKLMADVSQTSSKRVEVAAKNLRIVIGDQLNPVLDKVRNSGADALETAAEAVSQNPALVSTIAGTTTALGLLATGVSALMVAKAAAAAMQALNVTMLANPAVLITTAVVGLGVAIGTFVAQAQTADEQVAALTTSAQHLSETISAGASYEDTFAGIEAAGATVDRYITRLEELESQGELTDVQQQEYAMTLDKIQQLMPEINLEIDEQTGLLVSGASAIREHSKAWQDHAKMEAATNRYKTTVGALADAEYELAVNEAKLSMNRKDAAIIEKDLQDVTQALTAAQQKELEIQQKGNAYLGQTSILMSEANSATAALEKQQGSLRAQLAELNTEESALTEAISTGKEAITGATVEVEAAELAYQEYEQAMISSSENGVYAVDQMTENLTEQSQLAQEAYQEMAQAAYDSIDSQIGLFQDLSGESELTLNDMIDRLADQAVAFNNYADNLTIAMERGVDIGLIQKLSDGSAESMQILQEIVNGSDSQIDELNKAFEKTGDAKYTVAGSMADVQRAFDDSIEAMRWPLYEDGQMLGENTVDGMIAGVYSKEYDYTSAVRHIANAGAQEYGRVNMINSPSKRWEKLAQWDIAGLEKPYKEAVPKMQQTSKALADASYLESIRRRQTVLPTLTASISQSVQHDDSEQIRLLRQLLEAVKEGKVVALDGRTLIGATATGYDRALASNKILTDRGVI